MKNKQKVILLVLIVALLGLVIFVLPRIHFNQNKLPNSFTLNVKGDYTSSGAERNYEGTLTFANNKLISGTESYSTWLGGGCQTDCNKKYKCIIKDQQWIDAAGGGVCEISNYIPLTRVEIEQQIKNGRLKSFDNCGHLDTCYEIAK